MEAVEARQLLSAAVDHGVLTIQGTRRGDDIAVTLASPRTVQVVMNGERFTFDRRSVGKVKVLGNDGDDFISLGLEFTGPAYVSGGAGNDQIGGGSGDDTLYGDDGADQLSGSRGNDLLHGGAGRDYLNGYDGDDQLFGDANADVLSDGDGDDTLYGGRGGDALYEGLGRDRLCGGADRDAFYFADSPKDVRDETRDETIAPQPPPLDLSYHGPININIPNPGAYNPIKGWGGTIGGIIGNSGGSQGSGGAGGGIIIHGGSLIMSNGGVRAGIHTPTTPIVNLTPSPVTPTVRKLTFSSDHSLQISAARTLAL
jgi:hypothetical protein